MKFKMSFDVVLVNFINDKSCFILFLFLIVKIIVNKFEVLVFFLCLFLIGMYISIQVQCNFLIKCYSLKKVIQFNKVIKNSLIKLYICSFFFYKNIKYQLYNKNYQLIIIYIYIMDYLKSNFY